ncbi:MAG: rhomboid family intramembrane serine protease [Campylobacteraceae bacterium]|nr:rhomboid family intramembrane serine protease [Campylobacteraceae bacterium]
MTFLKNGKIHTSITIFTICINAIVFLLQMLSNGDMPFIFGLNTLFFEGFLWQPLSMMFIHGGLLHLAMNMAVLFQFGTLIEHARGKWFFILLYYAGGIVTSLLTLAYIYIFTNHHINVIGASGAICVLIGWIAQKDSFNRQGLIVAVLLISFLPLLAGINIAWHAHLIGFGVGWLIGKLFR